jgi:hypothetical protein
MRYGGSPKLSVAQQFVNLRANPISSGAGTINREGIVWHCRLSPTPLSRVYSVRIEYGRGKSPEVIVESPNLRLIAGGGAARPTCLQRRPHESLSVPTKERTVGALHAA